MEINVRTKRLSVLALSFLFLITTSAFEGNSRVSNNLIKRMNNSDGNFHLKLISGDSDENRAASYPGGDDAFINYVSSHVQYPKLCAKMGVACRLLVRFAIDTTGNISDIKIIEGCDSCPKFEQNVEKMLRNSPKWIPAVYQGRKIKAYREVPIAINLE